jgi:nucleoid DNA-binding protein
MIEIQADTSALEAAMSEFHAATRKAMPEIIREQGAILVGHMIALTPPARRSGANMADNGGVALDAKKQGESSIAADIAKIFPTTKLKSEAAHAAVQAGFVWQVGRGQKMEVREFAETVEHLASVHRYARNPKTGRTRKIGGVGMALTRKNVLAQYIRQQKQRVGILAAGWLNAGRELRTAGRNMPAWIKRHGARPGGAQRFGAGVNVGVRIFNSQTWFPGNMDTRVRLALDRRERGLRKAMEAILERRAAAANKRIS